MFLKAEAKLYELKLDLHRGDAMGTVLQQAEKYFDLGKARMWRRVRDLAATLVHASRIVAQRNSQVLG